MIRVAAAILLLAAGCTKSQKAPERPAAEESAPSAAVPVGQLPDSVRPLAYRLELTLVPERERFSGAVEIDVELDAPSKTLFLHGRKLKVEVAKLGEVSGTYREGTDTGAGTLTLAEQVPAGRHTLRFEYTAPFNRALEGIYRVDEAGESYAFSQFEAIGARLAFPSFDEPRFKVPFDLAVTAKKEHVVITTTPEVESEPAGEGMVRRVFARTKPLPTYLLAFAVGPLDVVVGEPIPPTPLRDRPIPLRAAAAKGKGERLRRALEDTAALVTTLEAYFGVAYPYAKLDLIAAPDYAFGAMENVGAIVYREERLLLDDASPVDQVRAYYGTHSHELAHQWFGNLVTPVWWTDIWLNESFATWMGNRATHVASPHGEYGRKTLRRAIGVMDEDSLASARRIREPVIRDEQIWNAFDGITYRKGGGVLAMFESYLGAEAFRDGVRLHMKRFAHDVADADDFAESLARGSKRPGVLPAFRSFIEQAGIPLVEVAMRCEDGKGSLRVTQSRYAPLGSSINRERLWGIPLCYSTFSGAERNGTECQIVAQKESVIALGACADAVLPNATGAGYYHFVLDSGFEALLSRFGTLSSEEQLATFSSVEAAYRSGRTSLDIVMRAAKAAVASPAWEVQLAPFELLWQLARDFESEEAARTIRALYGPRMRVLGVVEQPGEALGDRLVRKELVELVAMAGRDPKTREELEALADRHLAGETTAAERPVGQLALAVAAQQRGAAFVERLRDALETERDGFARSEMVFALAHAKNANDVLPLLLAGDELRTNERLSLLEHLFEYQHAQSTLAWLEANYGALVESLPSQFHGRIFEGTSEMCDAGALETVTGFQSSASDLRGVDLELAQARESIELCVALRKATESQRDGPKSDDVK